MIEQEKTEDLTHEDALKILVKKYLKKDYLKLNYPLSSYHSQ